MAHFSISKEFGLHNKKIYQDLAQKKLKSLDDLLNSSSSDDEEEEEEEDEDEDEENGNQDRDGNEEKNDEKTVCQRDEESGQLLEVFTYGAIHDPDCPQELSQIFLTPEDTFQVCQQNLLPCWSQVMNSPLPRSIVYPLYQILCTDTNEILLTEVCRTLCSLWSESHPISTTSLNLNDLELAWNLFLKQIHSEDLKCVSHGNLRSWLNFVGYLTSLQHKFLALSSQITSAPCRTPSFLSSEDLDWFSDSILQLMCITKLTDIFGCTETYSKPLQFDPLLKSSLHRACAAVVLVISCEKLTSQVDAHLSRLGTEVTKCFAVGQLKKNTSELVRKLACFCSQFSSSILCIPIYYPSTTPVRLDLISLALDCCWRGLNLLYESMAQNSQKVMVDESIVPQGEQPLNGETHIVSLIITHLRRMRLWEGSSSNSDPNRRGRSGDIWHDKIWSHFLHSYFIILNSYYSILAYKIKMDNPSPVMGVGNQNSRQSQLSETQASEFSNSVSLSSQNGGQTKSRKGRRKRKRSIGEVKDGEGYREEKEEDKQSKAPPNQSLLSSFTGLLTEAQEYKVFCRKTRVGPLYEISLIIDSMERIHSLKMRGDEKRSSIE